MDTCNALKIGQSLIHTFASSRGCAYSPFGGLPDFNGRDDSSDNDDTVHY
jgi:hypothetical protein